MANSSEKDLIRDEAPLSSFGNHQTGSGEHDRPPTPEKLAGPSESSGEAGLMVDSLLKGLSWLDRLLAPLVLIAMILGVVIGAYFSRTELISRQIRPQCEHGIGWRPIRGCIGSYVRQGSCKIQLTCSPGRWPLGDDVADLDERYAVTFSVGLQADL